MPSNAKAQTALETMLMTAVILISIMAFTLWAGQSGIGMREASERAGEGIDIQIIRGLDDHVSPTGSTDPNIFSTNEIDSNNFKTSNGVTVKAGMAIGANPCFEIESVYPCGDGETCVQVVEGDIGQFVKDSARFAIYEDLEACLRDREEAVVSPLVASPCVDSDGRDYYTKGSVEYNGQTQEDFCMSQQNSLREWVCVDYAGILEMGGQEYYCLNGCSDGACIGKKPSPQPCTDSDGGEDYYVRGDVTEISLWEGGEVYTDECTNGNRLQEYFCTPRPDSGDISSRSIVCPAGCSDGACIEQALCNDTVDNDGDGLIDLDDPGCTDLSDNDEADSLCTLPEPALISISQISGVVTRPFAALWGRTHSSLRFALNNNWVRVYLTDPRGTFEIQRVRLEAHGSPWPDDVWVVSFIDPRTNKKYLANVVMDRYVTGTGTTTTFYASNVVPFSQDYLRAWDVNYGILPGFLAIPAGPERCDIPETECTSDFCLYEGECFRHGTTIPTSGADVLICNSVGGIVNQCSQVGERITQDGKEQYCIEAGSSNWYDQRETGSYCSNDYECLNNNCADGICYQPCTTAGAREGNLYCDGQGMVNQKTVNTQCSNNYECLSDSCVNGVCSRCGQNECFIGGTTATCVAKGYRAIDVRMTVDTYCDGSSMRGLKQVGASCVEDYECTANSCVGGVCAGNSACPYGCLFGAGKYSQTCLKIGDTVTACNTVDVPNGCGAHYCGSDGILRLPRPLDSSCVEDIGCYSGNCVDGQCTSCPAGQCLGSFGCGPC